jgi:hypothetical protein
LYRLYRQIAKTNEKELLERFNVRIDEVGRLYTVINVPNQTDTYGPKDGPRITKTMLQNWLNKFDNYLVQIGLKELTQVQELTEIDEMNYLLVIRFKSLNIARIATNSIVVGTVVAVITVAALIVIGLVKLLL